MGWFKRAVRRAYHGPVLPRLEEGMHLLHEVLSKTALHNKYWINGGLLLGYVRHGKPLSHDPDVDFSVWQEDRPALMEGIEALLKAGFQKGHRWINNAGDVSEWSLVYRGVPFEFFMMFPVSNKMQWYCYGGGLELQCQAPTHGLEDFNIFDRTWKKPDDHETYLTALYGDWKVPNPNYRYRRDSKAIVHRSPWKGSNSW